MKKIHITILLLFVLMNNFAQERILYPKDIVNLLSENNSTIKLSRYGTSLSKNIYEQIISSSKPNVSFETNNYGTPLVGYNNLIPDTDTFTVSGGLAYNQLLPTGGSVSFSINDLFQFQNDSSDEWDITQTPSIDFTIYQPVFVNNKFIDFEVNKNSKRNSNITYNISKINEIDTKNQIITGVLSSVHMVNILRNSVVLLDRGIELSEEQVIMAREDRSRGRISSSDLLKIELDVAKQKEALFDVKYQLEISELNLGRVLGIDDIKLVKFDLNLFIDKKSMLDEADADLKLNNDEYLATLKLEQKELALKINRLSDAPILSLSVQSSAKDLEVDLDMNFNISLAMNFSLLDGGLNKKKLEADKISVEIAKENLRNAKLNRIENAKVLKAKIKLLEDKILLLKANIDYDKQLLEREKDLQVLGSSTNGDVNLVELDLLNIQKDLTNVYGELYITLLQVATLSGYSVEDYI